jgi:Flp pilus assembly protein TadD
MSAVPQPLALSLGLRPGDVAAVVRFAERDAARGRLVEAVETLRVAIILDPRELAAWDALACCFDRMGDASRAASAARVAWKVRQLCGREVTS